MSYIMDGLYLGSIEDACRTEELKKKGVTHILTVESRPLSIEHSEPFNCKYVHALDMESTDLIEKFEESFHFINVGREDGGVLVHCLAGQSRSATIVLGYLMCKLDLMLDDALTLLMKHRPEIRPNAGFMAQLKLFEAMGNKVDPRNDQYRQFRLLKLAQQMQSARLMECLPQGLMSTDPSLESQVSSRSGLYKCRKCRRPLFKADCRLVHETGHGRDSFDRRFGPQKPRDVKGGAEEVCNESLFVEPVQWMERSILSLEGKLNCPKCSAKLGSFNWAGERCPCGRWITPAFHIEVKKVDHIGVSGGVSSKVDFTKTSTLAKPPQGDTLNSNLNTSEFDPLSKLAILENEAVCTILLSEEDTDSMRLKRDEPLPPLS